MTLLDDIWSVFRCFTSTVESTKWMLPRHYQRNGTFWIYGDSLAVRLQASVRNRMLCRRFYKRCFHSYNWIYPVYNEWMNKVEDDDLDFEPKRVIVKILEILDEPFMQTEESVLLLNLGLHFPIGINFTTYQGLINDLIRSLKETVVDSRGIRVPTYKAKVIWKTSTAIHKENARAKNTTNWRFFTTQVCSTNSSNLFHRCTCFHDPIRMQLHHYLVFGGQEFNSNTGYPVRGGILNDAYHVFVFNGFYQS